MLWRNWKQNKIHFCCTDYHFHDNMLIQYLYSSYTVCFLIKGCKKNTNFSEINPVSDEGLDGKVHSPTESHMFSVKVGHE